MANPSPSRPKQEWFLDAKCEVHLPFNAALFGKANDFDDLILNCPNVELSRQNRSLPAADPKPIPSDNTDTTLAKDTPKPTKAIPILLNRLTRKRLFDRTERDNLERASDKLAKELDAAWKHDPLLTLKLIFRSRSIRFGEGSRHKLYRCAGWLYRHHPRTLMTNLQWLVRPVPGVESTEGPETSGDPSVKFSLENRGEDESGIADGASHGYWKDLLNILALAANDMLKVTDDPKGILNIPKPKKKSTAKPESRNVNIPKPAYASTHEVAPDPRISLDLRAGGSTGFESDFLESDVDDDPYDSDVDVIITGDLDASDPFVLSPAAFDSISDDTHLRGGGPDEEDKPQSESLFVPEWRKNARSSHESSSTHPDGSTGSVAEDQPKSGSQYANSALRKRVSLPPSSPVRAGPSGNYSGHSRGHSQDSPAGFRGENPQSRQVGGRLGGIGSGEAASKFNRDWRKGSTGGSAEGSEGGVGGRGYEGGRSRESGSGGGRSRGGSGDGRFRTKADWRDRSTQDSQGYGTDGSAQGKPKPEKRKKSKSAEFRAKRRKQHDRVVRNFEMVSVKAAKYKVLHLQIARLFADQLRVDIERLRSGDPEKQKRISLCAKWAPSTNRFHDRHTFVVSSIAERLYHDADEPSLAECKDKPHKRTEYLRRTRELYRKDCSLLRKHLDIVERHMSSKALNLIDYQQVPSVAMSQYSHLFAVKDGGRFEEHVTEVVSGKMQRIKDVPKLLPGQLVLPIRALKGVHLPKNERKRTYKGMPKNENKRTYKDMVTDAFNADKVIQVTDLQKKWDKLVTRMKESSILQDSMVVCDVSSQMMNTVFSDKTTALDIAMGLSLLIAYTNDTTASSGSGGSVLPFASESKMEWIDLKLKDTIDKSLEDTWCLLKNAVCEDTLALDAVFLKGILPGALKSNEARIPKRVFVFTVRSLEESVSGGGLSWTWASGHPLSVREKFANAKLDIPEVIFWNLATNLQPEDDARIASYYGVERVNGYSLDKLERYFGQALFENGKEGVEQVGRVSLGEENKRKKRKIDPHERVSNRAFEGLRIVD